MNEAEENLSCFTEHNTIVVPAHPKGFHEVFLSEHRWPNLKIDKRRLDTVKFIAIYQTRPVSAITHYARIVSINALEKKGRYDLVLDGNPVEIEHVKLTSADVCAVQGPRYTTLTLIENAKTLSKAFPS